ncbi:PrgI family protein [Spongiactinospora rosea]|uniref:PrgI family protein n=1 Tax=Spongiactinospora rosea TaxID=2248750 RepID=A0A366LTH4_9ACTN|nr:PrgI family protein [Spongiactinospora rosea]RBQ17255.1 PrgI family protein [Spongiactinospora rosea]
MNERVTIPANIDIEDRLIANLTGRQCVILTIAAAIIWAVHTLAGPRLPLTVLAGIAVPVLATAGALAFGQRDGLTLDRFLVAAWRQARDPGRLVFAPHGLPGLPPWAPHARDLAEPGDIPDTDRYGDPREWPGGSLRGGSGGHEHGWDERPDHGLRRRPSTSSALASAGRRRPPAPAWLPVEHISADGGIDLGGHGVAAIVSCSTISFALRTPAEQQALVDAFARWLNSLTGPVQIVLTAEAVNLAPAIQRLRADAPALPHVALEHAALQHAAFLARLDASRDLLRRRVLLVLREPHPPRAAGRHDIDGAGRRVLRRAEDACRALAAASVHARLLTGDQAMAALQAAIDPAFPPGLSALALPGATITRRRASDEHR